MVRRIVCALVLFVALAGGSAWAGKDRPHVGIPEPSNGQLCFEVFYDDFSQTICIPTPN